VKVRRWLGKEMEEGRDFRFHQIIYGAVKKRAQARNNTKHQLTSAFLGRLYYKEQVTRENPCKERRRR
jgi:hypothetical protein